MKGKKSTRGGEKERKEEEDNKRVEEKINLLCDI
jgi:hypothetical protein